MDTATTAKLAPQSDRIKTTGITQWEGRTFGAILLAAFFLYGIGSSHTDKPVGLVLVALNSAAVIVAGAIGFRLVRSSVPRVGLSYLTARSIEGVLLGGGVVLMEYGDSPGAGDAAYLLAMIALGIGSVPFCHTLGEQRWLHKRLALWGIAGYAALAAGAFLELVTGQALVVFFAIPGGLFELVLGILLLRQGFHRGDRVR